MTQNCSKGGNPKTLNPGPRTPLRTGSTDYLLKPPKQGPKAFFGEKISMAKKRKVLAFCLWLNRAGKDGAF